MAEEKQIAPWALKSREYRKPEDLNKSEREWYADLDKIQEEVKSKGYEELAMQIELAKRSLQSHGTRRITPTHKGSSGPAH